MRDLVHILLGKNNGVLCVANEINVFEGEKKLLHYATLFTFYGNYLSTV